MSNPAKEIKVADLKGELSAGKVHIFTDHTGLTVAEVSKLRRELKECGAKMFVAKNRLISIARDQAGLSSVNNILEGPTSIVISFEDPVAPAKVIKKCQDEINKLTVKAVVIDDRIYDVSRFVEITMLPGLDELRGMVVGGIAAPLTGIVWTMSGLLRGLTVALKAISEKKK